MSEEIKVLFPEGVETLTISKNDYDRLYGQLTYENIILQQKVEQLENIRKEAIEYVRTEWYSKNTKDIEKMVSFNDWKIDLYNILTKGSK